MGEHHQQICSNVCTHVLSHCSLGSGNGDEPSAKRRRLDVQEGEVLIGQFMSQAKSLLDNPDETEVVARLEALKEEILSKGNPYIQAIVSSCSDSLMDLS